jgi:hypothetical protein
MADLEDGPHGGVPGDVGGGCVLGVFHLVAEDQEVGFDVGEAFRGRFALRGVPDCRHGCGVCVFRGLREGSGEGMVLDMELEKTEWMVEESLLLPPPRIISQPYPTLCLKHDR